MGYLDFFRRIINEAYEHEVDISDWIPVGEVPGYYPWAGDGNKTYIFVDPQKHQYIDGTETYNIMYTENPDGSGRRIGSIPSFNKENAIVYPEHENDVYGEIFLGKKKDKERAKEMHREFLSKLFILDGKVILHHNSSVRITDGSIKKGKPNGYSNNSDIGIYFWGSEKSGRDPSGRGTYTYFCRIDPNELYDFETNIDRLTLSKALQRYRYVGQYWRDGEAICVNTSLWTRIWCIRENRTGKWFDRNWNEIKRPF